MLLYISPKVQMFEILNGITFKNESAQPINLL